VAYTEIKRKESYGAKPVEAAGTAGVGTTMDKFKKMEIGGSSSQ